MQAYQIHTGISAKKKRSLLILVLVGLIALVFAPSAYLQTVFDGFTVTLAAYAAEHPVGGPLVFAGLAACSVLLGPFSSVPFIPFAVAIWGVAPTFILLFCGWLAGNSAAYAIGRFAGRPLVIKIVGQKKVDRWLGVLEQHLNIWMLFVFRLAVPAETGYLFGVIGYRFSPYLVITFFAELPYAVLAVYSGDAFARTSWESLWGLLAVWMALIGGAYWLLMRHLKRSAK